MNNKRSEDNPPIDAYNFVTDFKCLGENCPDTCCSGVWNIHIDDDTIELYKQEAPELLNILDSEANNIAKLNSEGHCVALTKNKTCSIHKQYGENFLANTCYFFPRSFIKINNRALGSASLSCPEIARLVLYSNDPFEVQENIEINRTISTQNPIAFPGMSDKAIYNIFSIFKNFILSNDYSNEEILTTLLSVTVSLNSIFHDHWEKAASFLFSTIKDRPLIPFAINPQDPFMVLFILIFESQNKSKNFKDIVATISNALELNIENIGENSSLVFSATSIEKLQALKTKWQNSVAKALEPILKRYLQAMIINNFFPFRGMRPSIVESIIVIITKFLMTKLILMCHIKEDNTLTEKDIIKVIQTVSKTLDHKLTCDTFVAQLHDSGLMMESRIIGLINELGDKELKNYFSIQVLKKELEKA